jgi:hypothetical protein
MEANDKGMASTACLQVMRVGSTTMDKPARYVGHIVCLNHHVFRRVTEGLRRQGVMPENRFLVAAANRRLHQLVCYGGDLRITVDVSDVALV